MNLKSTCAAAVASAVLSVAVPAHAQEPPAVTFENIRDAVPGKYFDALTTVDSGSPNTLRIGFESGANAFTACAPSQLLGPLPCSNTRVAADTLSFVVRAPAGYYVSSITYDQAGTGAINRLADARGASSAVVAGVPIDLGGPFGGAIEFPAAGGSWSRSRTIELAATRATVVPVSLTTALFAYGSDLGSARVELASASVAVTVGPIVTTPAKKTATIEVVGFTGVYDGDFHGATGTAIGAGGENLSARLVFGDMFQNVPGGTVHWTFIGDATYNAASGTAAIVINPASAAIVVNGYAGTYDGLPHRPTGTATGISGIAGDLNARLNLGAAFTDVPGGTAIWMFNGDPNYHSATGAASIVISRATPALAWPAPASIAAGTPLSETQLNATANVAGTFLYNHPTGTVLPAGTHTLSVTFTPASTLNYNLASGSVDITVNPASTADLRIVNPGDQSDTVGDQVRLQIHVNGGTPSRQRGRGSDDGHRGGRLKGTFTAAGLPAGLRIEDDGEIRGKPTTAGNRRVVVTFTHENNGRAVSTAFDWIVSSRPLKNKKK